MSNLKKQTVILVNVLRQHKDFLDSYDGAWFAETLKPDEKPIDGAIRRANELYPTYNCTLQNIEVSEELVDENCRSQILSRKSIPL